MEFIYKLNRRDSTPYMIADELFPLKDGRGEGFLKHDNVNQKTIEIFTLPNRQGEKIRNYTITPRDDAMWKTYIQAFADKQQVYISYETAGDTVEAEDVNELQQAAININADLQDEKAQTKLHRDSFNNPHSVTKAQVGLRNADNTSDINKPVSTAQQAEIDAARKEAADALTAHGARQDNPHAVTKAQVGLGDADNTPDIEKPVSRPQQIEIDAARAEATSALAAHRERIDNPHEVTKAQVGLGNADNTSDMNKPVSTAQKAAIDTVANALVAHSARKDNPHSVTKAQVGLGNADNTSDVNKPVSTAQRAAIDAARKEATDALNAHAAKKDNPHAVTKAQVGLGSVDNVQQASKTAFDTHNADATRHITAAERTSWNDKYTRNEVDNKFSALETAIDWKESVATFADIAKTYPSPIDGWTVNVRDTDYTYRYDGAKWVAISANAIPKATKTLDGLLSKEDKTILDDAAAKRHTHANSAILAKLTQALLDQWNAAYSHVSDATRHITAAERTLWNTVSGKVDKVTGKALSTNDYTTAEKQKLAGIEASANRYVHPGSGTNPHGTTKADVGLGNVDNVSNANQVSSFTQASARANLVSGEKLSVLFGKMAKWYADLKSVAWTGNYNDLSNKPTIPGSLPPSGTAGGDLTGSYPSPTVRRIDITDTRNENPLPSAFAGKKVQVDFKSNTTIGLSDGGTYCTVITIKPWNDNSGGVPIQIALTQNRNLWMRLSNAALSAWGSWAKLALDGHTHTIANVSGLQAALDGKAAAGHTHAYLPTSGVTWNKLKGV